MTRRLAYVSRMLIHIPRANIDQQFVVGRFRLRLKTSSYFYILAILLAKRTDLLLEQYKFIK